VFDDLVAPSGEADNIDAYGVGPSVTTNRDLRNLGPRNSRIYALRPFAIFLKGMMDYLENLSERNVKSLFNTLFILAEVR